LLTYAEDLVEGPPRPKSSPGDVFLGARLP